MHVTTPGVLSPDPLFRRKALYSITDEKFGRAAVLTIMSSLYIHLYKEILINPSNEIPKINSTSAVSLFIW